MFKLLTNPIHVAIWVDTLACKHLKCFFLILEITQDLERLVPMLIFLSICKLCLPDSRPTFPRRNSKIVESL